MGVVALFHPARYHWKAEVKSFPMVYNNPIFIQYRHVIYCWKALDLSSSSDAILSSTLLVYKRRFAIFKRRYIKTVYSIYISRVPLVSLSPFPAAGSVGPTTLNWHWSRVATIYSLLTSLLIWQPANKDGQAFNQCNLLSINTWKLLIGYHLRCTMWCCRCRCFQVSLT